MLTNYYFFVAYILKYFCFTRIILHRIKFLTDVNAFRSWRANKVVEKKNNYLKCDLRLYLCLLINKRLMLYYSFFSLDEKKIFFLFFRKFTILSFKGSVLYSATEKFIRVDRLFKSCFARERASTFDKGFFLFKVRRLVEKVFYVLKYKRVLLIYTSRVRKKRKKCTMLHTLNSPSKI